MLTRRTSGLSPAERLVLEGHLSACEACARDAALLERMVSATREMDDPRPGGSPDGTGRAAVARAILRARERTAAATGAPRRRPAVLALAVAMSVLGVAAVSFAWSRVTSPEVARPVSTEGAPVLPAVPAAEGRVGAPATPPEAVAPEAVAPVAPETEPAQGAPSDVAPGDAASGDGVPHRPRPRSTAELPDVDTRIAAARRALAQGRSTEARAMLGSLLGAPLSPRQHAEAQSLLAECAQAEGDHAAAARAYGEVASRHGDALAGETALFAQARAQMRAGDATGARATLRRYLQAFPDGRFRAEAREHLHRLGEER